MERVQNYSFTPLPQQALDLDQIGTTTLPLAQSHECCALPQGAHENPPPHHPCAVLRTECWVAQTQGAAMGGCAMTTYNIRDYALPDAEPKRARPVLVGVVGVVVGLALGLGLGVGLGGVPSPRRSLDR
jgi:hypothetical protein